MVVFAGPQYCADDIIARDVVYLQQKVHPKLVVVTDDKELRRRCNKDSKRIAKKKNTIERDANVTVSIISSTSFADLLTSTHMESLMPISPSNDSTSTLQEKNRKASITLVSSPRVKSVMLDLNEEVELRRKLSQVQASLVTSSRQHRPRIQSRLKQIELRLQKLHSGKSQDVAETLRDLAAILNIPLEAPNVDGSVTESSSSLMSHIFSKKYEILSGVLDLLRYDKSHVEDTWERVILAERMRSRLEMLTDVVKTSSSMATSKTSLLAPYLDQVNSESTPIFAPFVMS